jgi:hypothetical protein
VAIILRVRFASQHPEHQGSYHAGSSLGHLTMESSFRSGTRSDSTLAWPKTSTTRESNCYSPRTIASTTAAPRIDSRSRSKIVRGVPIASQIAFSCGKAGRDAPGGVRVRSAVVFVSARFRNVPFCELTDSAAKHCRTGVEWGLGGCGKFNA